MMNAIVFVNPPLSIEDRYGVKFQSGGQTPPLGLTNLAAMTRQHGFPTAILDAAALGLDYGAAVRTIIEGGFRYVGITAVTISVGHAARLAHALKEADPRIVTLLGGPHVSAVPEETMTRYPAFDIGVIGEADYSIVELLQALETQRDLGQVRGIVFRHEGRLVLTPPAPPIMNLDELPKPAWDLLPDMARYYCPPVHTLKRIPAGLLIASRGCPGQCTFCASAVFGRALRAYSAAYTFDLIKELYDRYGMREIQLRDDNFIAYRKRMVELCALLKQAQLDLVWTCAGRVDMVNPDILKLMREAGCWQIWYGIESGSQAILDVIKKHTKLSQIEKAVTLTRQAGISPCGFFILGHPTETTATLEATIDLAVRLPLDEAHFGFMTPLPGSELYRRVDEYGQFDRDWSRCTGWLPVFVPHGLTADLLERYSNKAFRRFFFRPRIILSYLKKIRSWRHLKIYLSGLLALLEFLLTRKSGKVKLASAAASASGSAQGDTCGGAGGPSVAGEAGQHG